MIEAFIIIVLALWVGWKLIPLMLLAFAAYLVVGYIGYEVSFMNVALMTFVFWLALKKK